MHFGVCWPPLGLWSLIFDQLITQQQGRLSVLPLFQGPGFQLEEGTAHRQDCVHIHKNEMVNVRFDGTELKWHCQLSWHTDKEEEDVLEESASRLDMHRLGRFRNYLDLNWTHRVQISTLRIHSEVLTKQFIYWGLLSLFVQWGDSYHNDE